VKKIPDILLIENDRQLALEIVDWLQNIAHVVHVTDCNQAKVLVAQNIWQIIIPDFNISVKDSLEIIQLAKAKDPHCAVLILAENLKVELILEAMQHHADGLLFKPLQQAEFVKRILTLTEEAALRKGEKIILALGAHPDDVEFGCGGTLAKLQAEGHAIHIAILSLGGAGGNPETRKKEARLAAQYFNATLYLGDFEDTKITHAPETISFIEDLVQKIRPTHVYTHSVHDSHQDHINTFQATLTACRHTQYIFSYQSPSTTTQFCPNIFININHFIDRKLEVLRVFESQNNIRPYLEPDLIRAAARYWGKFSDYQLVEPMEVVKGSL